MASQRRSRHPEQQEAYSGITKTALGDGLEEGGFANVGKTDDTSLQVVTRAAQEHLLLSGVLLRGHFGSTTSLSVGTGGEVYDGATRPSGR
ncbi:hypothetical protein RRF57_008754 [Xylaria bambusicola]|uniref:Uncharacterized protein n=1 Tax=Xylaria bambusicola TaxID=326684 RepID=A0AAN7USL7_9PEZI